MNKVGNFIVHKDVELLFLRRRALDQRYLLILPKHLRIFTSSEGNGKISWFATGPQPTHPG